jgi:hypothetical protein
MSFNALLARIDQHCAAIDASAKAIQEASINTSPLKVEAGAAPDQLGEALIQSVWASAAQLLNHMASCEHGHREDPPRPGAAEVVDVVAREVKSPDSA